MDPTAKLQMYSTGFTVCMVITIIALIAAGLVFFLMDIRSVYALRSGHMKLKAVQKLNARNEQTGRLRKKFNLDYGSSGNLDRSGKSGSFRMSGDEVLSEDLTSMASEDQGEETTPLKVEIPQQQRDALSHQNMIKDQEEQKEQLRPKNGFWFDITENIVVIHTDERIDEMEVFL